VAAVTGRDTITVRNVTNKATFEVRLMASPRERKILIAGGVLNIAGKKSKV
jgi:hypothetical protein